MSTNIYGGLKLTDKEMTLSQTQEFLDQVRPLLMEGAKKALMSSVIIRAVSALDHSLCKLRGLEFVDDTDFTVLAESSPLSTAIGNVYDYIESTRQSLRRCHLEPAMSATLYADTSGVYAIIRSEIKGQNAIFMEGVGATSYWYSNQGDPEDGISYEDWEARGAHWDRLLGPTSVISARGFDVQLVSPDLIFSLREDVDAMSENEMTSFYQDFDSRVLNIARSLVEFKCPETHQKMKISDYMDHDKKLREGANPDFNKKLKEIASWLPRHYPLEAFREKREDLKKRYDVSIAPKFKP